MYFQVLRNGGGEEVKPNVIGRSKNTRVPPIVGSVLFETGKIVSEMAWTADIYLTLTGRRIGEGVDGHRGG